MDTIRIGIIGLGGICRTRHVPGLQAIDGVELAAVCNRSSESGEAAAREFGIPLVCESWHEIVESDDIDAVVIGTWPYLHKDISIAALEAGKHVFCQARMAMNLDEAVAMHAAAQGRGLVTMLCPVPFGLSVGKTVQRLLREGVLGDVHLVRVLSLTGAWVDPESPMNWRKNHHLSGLNMQTLGMHAEVMHRWFGPSRQISAHSQIYTPQRPDADGVMTEIMIPDQIQVTGIMDHGVVVQYAFTGMAARAQESIDIFGTRGTLHYDVTSDVLHHVEASGAMRPVEILPEDAYDVKNWRVEQDFIAAIREGAPYYPSFDDGLAYMRVVQAVHDSARTGGALITL